MYGSLQKRFPFSREGAKRGVFVRLVSIRCTEKLALEVAKDVADLKQTVGAKSMVDTLSNLATTPTAETPKLSVQMLIKTMISS